MTTKGLYSRARGDQILQHEKVFSDKIVQVFFEGDKYCNFRA